jgi:hypothetical protein
VRDKVDGGGIQEMGRKEKESRGSNLISTSTNKNTQGDERTNNNNRVEIRMMTVI